MFRQFILFMLIFFQSCIVTSGDIKDTVRNLEKSQFSASGSDLTLAICGWQPDDNMKFENIKVDLFPDSTSKSGRGYMYIDAKGKDFQCSSKIFFVYTSAYTGGHGSYENYLRFSSLTKENETMDQVSSSPLAKPAMLDSVVSGLLTEESNKLPDGAFADFYSIDIKKKTGIKLEFENQYQKNFYPRCHIYQNNKFISKDDSTGSILNPGRIYLMISGGTVKGEYKMRISEMTEAERSRLRQ